MSEGERGNELVQLNKHIFPMDCSILSDYSALKTFWLELILLLTQFLQKALFSDQCSLEQQLAPHCFPLLYCKGWDPHTNGGRNLLTQTKAGSQNTADLVFPVFRCC